MPRAIGGDLLQSFRFHVVSSVLPGEEIDPLVANSQASPGGEAGFQSVTLPELTVEAVEYREGTFKWTRKYPGIPTWGDVTLMQGIARSNTVFMDWAKRVATGGEYRVDLTIYHAHRDESPPEEGPQSIAATSRYYVLHNAFPVRAKMASDLDSSTGDVSVAEMDVAYEYADITAPEAA